MSFWIGGFHCTQAPEWECGSCACSMSVLLGTPIVSEKAMAPRSRTLAWKIPWTEEPGGLQSMGSLESDTTERRHFHFWLSGIGEGNGNPLQCSCLESPRDGEAWWAAVYGVAQSRTRLKRLSSIALAVVAGNTWSSPKRPRGVPLVSRELWPFHGFKHLPAALLLCRGNTWLPVVICSPWIIKSFALKKESQRVMCALCVSFEVDLLKVLPVLSSFPSACPQAISAKQASFTAPLAFWIEKTSELWQRCCSYHNCPQGGDTAPWTPGLLGKQTPENLAFLACGFQKTMPEERPQGVSLSSSFL